MSHQKQSQKVFTANALILLFYDGCPYYIETSPMICFVNQWIGFYMIGTIVIKELKTDWCDKIRCLKYFIDILLNILGSSL